ncbi:hypothetical protein Pla110_28420 [Polystyrenella longa]|uniref:Uncharacterized protein n=1 Tax=Polystyrenella longa TaxID=2528007 RepID=A0A518CPF3_9PLAN|nr:hypothetical protein Pla110_28420 [Polystyrenella longa]
MCKDLNQPSRNLKSQLFQCGPLVNSSLIIYNWFKDIKALFAAGDHIESFIEEVSSG